MVLQASSCILGCEAGLPLHLYEQWCHRICSQRRQHLNRLPCNRPPNAANLEPETANPAADCCYFHFWAGHFRQCGGHLSNRLRLQEHVGFVRRNLAGLARSALCGDRNQHWLGEASLQSCFSLIANSHPRSALQHRPCDHW